MAALQSGSYRLRAATCLGLAIAGVTAEYAQQQPILDNVNFQYKEACPDYALYASYPQYVLSTPLQIMSALESQAKKLTWAC